MLQKKFVLTESLDFEQPKMWLFIVLTSLLAKYGYAQNTGFFWHITDMHYDPWYDNPLGISCNEDIQNPGEFGDYECDAPWKLVQSSVEEIRNIDNTNPAFILWSGDNPPHVYNKSMEVMVDNDVIIDITRNITNLIKDAFPGKVVLPMVGNHDYYPKNQLPGEENDLYNAFYNMWSDWLNTTDMETTFRKGAYYSRVISEDPKVHAVVLNTNLYYHSNRATDGQEDPGDQIAWFENIMQEARQNGEKAYLFYHVPFGKVPEPVDGKGWLVSSFNSYFEQATVDHSDVILAAFSCHSHTDVYKLFYDDSAFVNITVKNCVQVHVFTHIPLGIQERDARMCKDEFNKKFIQLFVEYNDIIIASYGVHTHTDVFRLFFDNDGNPVSSMFIAPSVTPWRVPLSTGKTPPHNPGLRRVYFDKTTYKLTDYTQYSLDLPRANNGDVNWRMLYSFAQYYGVDNIQPEALNSLLQEFKEYGSNKYNKYYDAVYLNTRNDDYMPCDCDCKSSHLCAIEFVDYDKYEDCYANRPACGACTLKSFGLVSIFALALIKMFI